MSDTALNNTLTLQLRRYSKDADRHQHDHHQLVLPVSGTLKMDIEGEAGEVSKHRLALITAGNDHEFSAQGDNCFVVADIPAALAPELERLPRFIELDPALGQYIDFLGRQLGQQKANSGTEGQMLLLLIQLLKERFGDSVRLDRRVEAARRHLEQYYDQSVSQQQLAIVANLSQRQLTELFRRELGMTPHQYLTEIRMQKAWQLLQESRLHIQQVANQVGYSNLAAFSDRFRRHFGRSPRHFRQISE